MKMALAMCFLAGNSSFEGQRNHSLIQKKIIVKKNQPTQILVRRPHLGGKLSPQAGKGAVLVGDVLLPKVQMMHRDVSNNQPWCDQATAAFGTGQI